MAPQGVSGAIKRAGGYAPFREFAAARVIAAGDVGGNASVSRNRSRRRADDVGAFVGRGRAQVLAMPLIGAGTGGLNPERVQALIVEEAERAAYNGRVVVVRFTAKSCSGRRPRSS